MTGRVLVRGHAWWAVAGATALSVGLAGVLGADRAGLPRHVGFLAGCVAAALAVLALPSVPTRAAALAILGLGGLVTARHASIPGVESDVVVAWAVATLVALVVLERVHLDSLPGGVGRGPRATGAVGEVVRLSLVLGVLVALLAVPLTPVVQAVLDERVRTGEAPGFEQFAETGSPLRGTDRLDMTTRPRLGDSVVFSVRASRPSFWRGELFDVWDGSTWTRSRGDLVAARGERPTRIVPEAHDDAASDGSVLVHTVTLEASFARPVFSAPSPVTVEASQALAQRADGTVLARQPMGRGTTYTVTSRTPDATEATLRAADERPVPAEVLARYAAAPVATERVRALADEIAAGSGSTYDTVLAFEAWMGRNTRYSLDAPLSPRGVDVVDHFLFDAREGWCEQVASSLVVLLRTQGIPARLATGFVPGEYSSLTGRFVVRERDAHAWAEVYFPGVGWQGFDPTAEVPLAGEAPRATTIADRLVALAPVLLALLAVATGGWWLLGRARALRRSRAPRRGRGTWGRDRLHDLERVGRRAGRPRAPAETVREYASVVAGIVADERIVAVGDAIERDAWAAQPLTAQERAPAESVLEDLRREGRRGRRGGRRASVPVDAS